MSAAVAQSVRAFAFHEEGWVFPVATDLSRKTGSDRSTANRSPNGVSVSWFLEDDSRCAR